jgi:hypothetical protein
MYKTYGDTSMIQNAIAELVIQMQKDHPTLYKAILEELGLVEANGR